MKALRIGRRYSLFFTMVLGLVAGEALEAQGQQLRLPLVDRSILFHGGELYRSTETRLLLCSKSGCFEVTARLDGGLYTYTVTGMVSAVKRTVVASNDQLAWTQNGERRPVPTEFDQRLRDWVMEKVYFCFLPYRLNDPGTFKEDRGLEVWSDRQLHKIKVTFQADPGDRPPDEYLYWFDPESARLEQFAYRYSGSPGGLRFRRLINFRKVGGILFADQENWGVEGDEFVVDQVTQKFIENRMRLVSQVSLKDIGVRTVDR
jgi:hypothetical protein